MEEVGGQAGFVVRYLLHLTGKGEPRKALGFLQMDVKGGRNGFLTSQRT